jgi:hypothetical protein
MSRLFDGVDDTVRWSIGSCNITGDWTMAYIIKLDSGVSWQSYLGTNTSAGASAAATGRHSDGRLDAMHGGGAQFFSAAVTHSNSDGWMIGIVSKVAGNNQPIASKFPIGGAWTHTTMSSLSGTPANPASQAGGTVRWGEIDGADFFKGRLAACAIWTSALSQANKETLATLTRANWLSLTPQGLWDEIDAFATDHTGNGASRTTLTGTADDADDPTGWASWEGAVATPIPSLVMAPPIPA